MNCGVANSVFSRREKRDMRNAFGPFFGSLACDLVDSVAVKTGVLCRTVELEDFHAFQECPKLRENQDFHCRLKSLRNMAVSDNVNTVISKSETGMTYTLTVNRYNPTDPRLGRHVAHDSRSLKFLALPKDAKPKKINKLWPSVAKPLNQGDTGSCTGNALTNFLNSSFSDAAREFKKRKFLTEADALTFYHWATVEDSYAGTYPPTDT